MLKLLLGWGLALEDALVDEIRDVMHYVFAQIRKPEQMRRP
jgi:hypothetical protein